MGKDVGADQEAGRLRCCINEVWAALGELGGSVPLVTRITDAQVPTKPALRRDIASRQIPHAVLRPVRAVSRPVPSVGRPTTTGSGSTAVAIGGSTRLRPTPR